MIDFDPKGENIHRCFVGDAENLPLEDKSIDLILGSPPYLKQRNYGGKVPLFRSPEDWVAWMLRVTLEGLRVSRGAVLWVVGNPSKHRNYQPCVEGLIWEGYKAGLSAYRPLYWKRNGIPGSGGDQWFASVIEHIVCFKPKGKLPFSDPLATAEPCKYPRSGACTNRTPNGTRRDTTKYPVGEKVFRNPELANPGNLLFANVGKGHMGSSLAHENEAPYPERLIVPLILSLSRPGDTVLDPFCGSGTTQSVAVQYHRKAIGVDLRADQVDLAIRRVALATPVFPEMLENPHRRQSRVQLELAI